LPSELLEEEFPTEEELLEELGELKLLEELLED